MSIWCSLGDATAPRHLWRTKTKVWPVSPALRFFCCCQTFFKYGCKGFENMAGLIKQVSLKVIFYNEGIKHLTGMQTALDCSTNPVPNIRSLENRTTYRLCNLWESFSSFSHRSWRSSISFLISVQWISSVFSFFMSASPLSITSSTSWRWFEMSSMRDWEDKRN